MDRARQISGLDGPPQRPGLVALIAVGRGDVSLWVFSVDDRNPFGNEGRHFIEQAQEAWKDVLAALPRHLPVIWTSLSHRRSLHRQALEIEARHDGGATESPSFPVALDGRSFGLSFGLALTSDLLGVCVPDDLAASAAVNAMGEVLPVDAIGRKVRALREMAPRVRRILVAPDNAQEAREASKGSMEVIPVDRFDQALALVFGSDIWRLVENRFNSPGERRAIVDGLFRLAMHDSLGLSTWEPVRNMAGRALEVWTSISATQRWKLQCAQAIASRHLGREDVLLSVPRGDMLRSVPVTVRLAYIAHWVQQAADTGCADRAEVLRVTRRCLVRGREAHPDHLRVLGALARYEAVAGDPVEAIALAREAATGWTSRFLDDQSAHPLCLWYHLAAALEDRREWKRADRFRRTLEQQVIRDLIRENPFVALAYASGKVLLGDLDDEAFQLLEGLDPESGVPAHIGWSALRWRVTWLWKSGRKREAEEGLKRFDGLTGSLHDQDGSVTCNRALLGLWLAIEQGDRGGVRVQLQALRAVTPGLMRNLEAFAKAMGRPFEDMVWRFYPY